MLPRPLCFAAFLALSVGAAACGAAPTNAAPVIDSVDTPVVVAEQSGAYTIPVTVLFHDHDGEAVTHVRYRLGATIEGTVALTGANPTRESATVALVITRATVDDEVLSTLHSAPDGRSGGGDNNEVDRDGREHGRGRGQTRLLQLTLIDARGAESLPQSSTITLQ